jgi:hypothetical protein
MSGVDTSIANEEFWSSVGYWIVVGGLVGDIIVLVVPKHREHLEKVLSAIFTIVIIIGVAIEHRADASISILISQGQQASGLQIAHLNTEAGDARRIAGEAEERAAKLEKEAASLREDAEHEHLARVQLEAAIAPRLLTMKQQKEIVDICRSVAKPTTRIVVETSFTNTLGFQILGALREAGFSVDLEWTNRALHEVSMGGPLEYADALTCIGAALAGKVTIIGTMGILPSGSPIRITVGERVLGQLPK